MKTETIKLAENSKVFLVQADSFPEGVLKAHQTLHALVPYSPDRNYYGISYPDRDGSLTYKAAATELKTGELASHNLEEFIIPKGEYRATTILNFQQNMKAFSDVFQLLIKDPKIDPEGFCLEWYINDQDCMCMVKLAD